MVSPVGPPNGVERRKRGRRPRAQEPAKKFVGFWVTDVEYQKLQLLAKDSIQDVGPCCRDTVLDAAEEAAENRTN